MRTRTSSSGCSAALKAVATLEFLLLPVLPVASLLLFPAPAYAITCGFGSDIGGGQCRGYLVTPGAGSWTVPADWSSTNTIEVIGGGGGGLVNSNTWWGSGGGGGAYAKVSNVSGLSGSISYTVGAGGAGTTAGVDNAASDGTDTFFNGASLPASSVGAKAGHAPDTSVDFGGTGAAGGLASASVGTTKYDGGNGGVGDSGSCAYGAAGGGGAAGPSGSGKAGGICNGQAGGGGGGADNGTAGANPSGDTVGGNGGDGPLGSGGGAHGAPPAAGTAGGGGGGADNTGTVGGAGGPGTEWDSTHGAGGGGGGGSNGADGGDGGNYGGGGAAGAYTPASTNGGDGGNGIIVITYTPTGGGEAIPARGVRLSGSFILRLFQGRIIINQQP